MGGGIGMGNTCKPMAVSFQCMTKSTTNKKKKLKKKLMSIESVMLSNYLIVCHPLLLTSIFPNIRVFSNESVLCVRWPNIRASASTSVLPVNIQD